MKYIFFGILLLFSNFLYADVLDQMRIYVNHQLIATSYEGDSQFLELEVSEGDTLTFELSTDWGGENKATLSVFDYISSEQVLELKHPTSKLEVFEQIVKPDLINSELLFVLNFNIKSVGVWRFARIILKTKNQ